METALVNRILPFSSVDGPGNRTAVFLQGCNFDCRYCHNPETIRLCVSCGACLPYCKTGALSLQDGHVTYDFSKCVFCDECFRHCPNSSSPRVRRMTAVQVMDEVKRNLPFIRGITVSGGECTQQRDFLLALLTLAKAEGLGTLLDSNGSYDFSADPALLAVTDGVMLDVKAWSPDEHLRITGQTNAMVRQNLSFLAASGKLTEVRTVIVPGLFDVRETVRETARAIAPFLSVGNVRCKIIRYRPQGVRPAYRSMTEPDDALLAELRALAESEGLPDVVTT